MLLQIINNDSDMIIIRKKYKPLQLSLKFKQGLEMLCSQYLKNSHRICEKYHKNATMIIPADENLT